MRRNMTARELYPRGDGAQPLHSSLHRSSSEGEMHEMRRSSSLPALHVVVAPPPSQALRPHALSSGGAAGGGVGRVANGMADAHPTHPARPAGESASAVEPWGTSSRGEASTGTGTGTGTGGAPGRGVVTSGFPAAGGVSSPPRAEGAISSAAAAVGSKSLDFGGEGGAMRSVLLEQSVQSVKALQHLAKEKEALHEALTKQAERLRASESARQLAEERALRLEAALQAVQTTVGSVLN